MSTSERRRTTVMDPAVETVSAAGWRRWVEHLARRAPERLLGFSGAIALGFLTGLFVMWAFVKLADEVLGQETAALDSAARIYMQRFDSPELTLLMRGISLMGSEAIWVLGVLLLLLFIWQRRWGAATIVLIAVGGAQLLNDALKSVFHRSRPIPLDSAIVAAQVYSFPSGHAMVSAAFYFYLAYLSWRLVRGWKRIAIIGLLVLLTLLIGLSRVYLEAHYLSDVLGGYLAGFLWTDAVIIGSRLLVARPRQRRARATLNR